MYAWDYEVQAVKISTPITMARGLLVLENCIYQRSESIKN